MRRYILFFLILCGTAAFSQSLEITSVSQSLPDTAALGDTTTYSAYLKNNGPAAFSGTVGINFGSKDSFGAVTITHVDSVTGSISPGDSLWVLLLADFDQAGFRLGTNVVVIWPVPAGGGSVFDVYEDTVVITNEVGIREMGLNGLSVYPNPFIDQLYLSDPGSISTVEIKDLTGKMIFRGQNLEEFSLTKLNSGIYLLVVEASNGQKKLYRVVKVNE
jgi:hypothetical protein